MTLYLAWEILAVSSLGLTYQRDFYKSKSDPDSVNWTHDQLIYSQSLYQLSYIRVPFFKSASYFHNAQDRDWTYDLAINSRTL